MANNASGRQEPLSLADEEELNIKNEQLSPTIVETPANDDEICELEHLRKLFIGGLAPYTTEENLKNFYGQWGKVVDVVVMRDPNTKRSRGFGFITYTKSKMVDAAQANRPHVIDGKTVEAKRALPRPERESRETNISVKKLFVGGLKDNHDEECLHEYFSQFGEVISIKILTDKTTGKRRGFAFIEYDDYDAVDKAILKKSHSIKYVVVDVKKSIYQEQQLQRLKTDSKPMQQQNKNVMPMMNNKQQQMSMPPNSGYRPQAPAPMPPYQQQMPMPGVLGTPPPGNYNWGAWSAPPPGMPPHQPPPYGYPPQPQHWNYPPAPPATGWQTGPPPPSGPPPPGNWQWGAPPQPQPVGPPPQVNQAPPANWNVQAVPPTASVPPQAPPVATAPAATVPPPQQPPPQQPPTPNNFGVGYQQSYSGGPTKQNNLNANRANPYNVQQQPNKFGNNVSQPSATGYGSYNARTSNGSTITNGAPANPNNKFRR